MEEFKKAVNKSLELLYLHHEKENCLISDVEITSSSEGYYKGTLFYHEVKFKVLNNKLWIDLLKYAASCPWVDVVFNGDCLGAIGGGEIKLAAGAEDQFIDLIEKIIDMVREAEQWTD